MVNVLVLLSFSYVSSYHSYTMFDSLSTPYFTHLILHTVSFSIFIIIFLVTAFYVGD